MKSLEEVIRLGKVLRVAGFDDAPFGRERGGEVPVCGVICAATRFEGMLWGRATRDGADATDVISEMLLSSKFHRQVHVVLLDGVAIGGFNVIDVHELHARLARPILCVMRKAPDLARIHRALEVFEDAERRSDLIRAAGDIHHAAPFYFQAIGTSAETGAEVLRRLTDQGHVPEALRLAHLIGSAVMTGESSRRA